MTIWLKLRCPSCERIVRVHRLDCDAQMHAGPEVARCCFCDHVFWLVDHDQHDQPEDQYISQSYGCD